MPINSLCTGCGKALSVADEHAGKRARCPACGQIYTVPLASTTQAENSGEILSPLPDSTTNSGSAINWGPAAAANPVSGQPQAGLAQYWMRAAEGAVYGPVDQQSLDRWFKEGRVGIGYQIRQGETGGWQDAALFRPQVQTNPYAATVPNTPLHHYPKSDRGLVVLIMGILAFVVCGAFGIVAVIMGRSAMRDINAGLANPNDRVLVQIGFWLGVANLILHLLIIGGLLLAITIGIISEAR